MNFYIENEFEFNRIWPLLKEKACVCESPKIYHIGLDIEYISEKNFEEDFTKSNWVFNKASGIVVCILSISTKDINIVINLKQIGPTLNPQLIEIITSRNWIKTGVGVDLDVKYLSENFNLKNCFGYIDISLFASISGIKTPNLEYCYQILVDPSEKKDKLKIHNWSQEITERDFNYCLKDSKMSYETGKVCIDTFINVFKQSYKNNSEIIESLANEKIAIEEKQKINSISDKQIVKKDYISKVYQYFLEKKYSPPSFCFQEITENKFQCLLFHNETIYIGIGSSKQEAKHNCSKNFLEKNN